MNERQARLRGSWLARRVRSFAYAWRGMIWLVWAQPNARIHLAATFCVFAVAAWLKISPIEWCAILVVIGLVWSAEALNSALELLADHLAPDEHPLVGRAKDVAAGGVLVAAIVAVAVGVIILGPKLLEAFEGNV
jgi:diacylglycerol kinase (ATP)